MTNNLSLINKESNSQLGASWASLDAYGVGISWSWKDWIPNGFLTLLVGDVGLGKSTIALRICASFLTGMDWLDGSHYSGNTGYVVWCEAESGQYMNLDRAKRWGLPLDNIVSPLEYAFEDFNLSNPAHKKALKNWADRDDVMMVVIDSLRGAIEGDENNSETSSEVKYLAHLAQETQKPIIMVHHLRKKSIYDSSEKIGLERVRGTSSIAQFPRVVIALSVPNSDYPDKRELSVIKNNLGLFPKPIGLSITDHGIEVVPDFERYNRPQKATQRDRAKDYLKEFLKDGYKPSKEVYAVGADKGLDKQTLQRAKKDLGILARRLNKMWVWEFPQNEQPSLIPK